MLCSQTRRRHSPGMFIAPKTSNSVAASALVHEAAKVPRKVESYRAWPSQRQQQSLSNPLAPGETGPVQLRIDQPDKRNPLTCIYEVSCNLKYHSAAEGKA